MQAVLTQIRDGESIDSIIIRPGFGVVVGSNPASEFCIEDEGLASRHFSLAFEGLALRIQNLAANGQRLWIDGRAETNRVIGHGTRIRAGNVEFHVAVDVPESTTAPSPSLTSRLEFRLQVAMGGAGLLSMGPVDSKWPGWIATIAAGRTVILAVNRQHARIQLPFPLAEGQDLFGSAPPEIRRMHSLHMLPISEEGGLEHSEIVQSILEADAGMLLISSKSLPELIESKRLFWAWFAKPSLLRFQVQEGSDQLARQLMADLEVIILSLDGHRLMSLLGPIEKMERIAAELLQEVA